MSYQCASCGKADANLKACKACKLVKYCSVDCQVAHRSIHKKACREKARELYEQKLYAQPPRKEDCPICMILLSCNKGESVYMTCCGKRICGGCYYCLRRDVCPFCNTADPKSNEETIKRISERINKYNDPGAMNVLGGFYQTGRYGLPVDPLKALELFQRASELGFDEAHFNLGINYQKGVGVKVNKEKGLDHWKNAAMMGNAGARGMCQKKNLRKHCEVTSQHVMKQRVNKEIRLQQCWQQQQRDRAAAMLAARE
eukprot:scaffold37567_cov36-Cyclotella_meneghiniana.AAC.3